MTVMCTKGRHEMVPTNTFKDQNGTTRCRGCSREYQRHHQREIRAAAKRLAALEAAGLVDPAPGPFDR